MNMNSNIRSISLWTTTLNSSAFARFIPWRKKSSATISANSMKLMLADLVFLLSGEIVNLKQYCLNEDTQELGYQWRKCTIALLDCRKALRRTQDSARKENLHKEYLAIREQHKLLRRNFRAVASQSYAPVQAHLKQLRSIKIRIAKASDGKYRTLRIEFYRTLMEAKTIVQGRVEKKVTRYI